MVQPNNKILLGWREWVTLPELNLGAIKAKIDTGAKTSALHAHRIEYDAVDGVEMVRFWMHPLQKDQNLIVSCEAPLLDRREVSDSGGHREVRPVIRTDLVIGQHRWSIELSLTDRDSMRFRMLLGRRAMKDTALVDPSLSFVNGRLDPKNFYL